MTAVLPQWNFKVIVLLLSSQPHRRNILSDFAHRQQLNSGVKKSCFCFLNQSWHSRVQLRLDFQSEASLMGAEPPDTAGCSTLTEVSGWTMAENVQLQRCGGFCKYRWMDKEQNAWSVLSGGSAASLSSFPFLSLQFGPRLLKLPDVSNYVLTSGSNYRKIGNGNDGR